MADKYRGSYPKRIPKNYQAWDRRRETIVLTAREQEVRDYQLYLLDVAWSHKTWNTIHLRVGRTRFFSEVRYRAFNTDQFDRFHDQAQVSYWREPEGEETEPQLSLRPPTLGPLGGQLRPRASPYLRVREEMMATAAEKAEQQQDEKAQLLQRAKDLGLRLRL